MDCRQQPALSQVSFLNLPLLEATQEAGLDGFLIHRVLASERIESHIVDPASTLTSRRRRRANTDKDRQLRRKTTAERPWSTRHWLPRGSNTFSRIKRPLLAPGIFDYDLLPVTAGRGWNN